MFRAIKLKRDSLVDRHSHSFRRGITLVTRVNRDGLKS
jgi:hypothetical protein